MEPRALFVLDAWRDRSSMSELYHRHRISRKAGYKCVARSHGQGAQQCSDRLRALNHHPNRIRRLVVEKLVVWHAALAAALAVW